MVEADEITRQVVGVEQDRCLARPNPHTSDAPKREKWDVPSRLQPVAMLGTFWGPCSSPSLEQHQQVLGAGKADVEHPNEVVECAIDRRAAWSTERREAAKVVFERVGRVQLTWFVRERLHPVVCLEARADVNEGTGNRGSFVA